MQLALGQRPEGPGLCGTKFQFPLVRLPSDLRVVSKHPLELGRGEIAVEQQACFFAELVRVHARNEVLADGLTARVLPDDCGCHRLSRTAIP